VFEQVKFILKNKIYKISEKDYCSPHFFNMIIDVSLKLNQVAWCEKLMETFIPELNPVNSQNIISFSKVRIFQKMKNYNAALDMLAKVNPQTLFEKLSLRSIELKIFYDMNDYDKVFSLIKSNMDFILNDKGFTETVLIPFRNTMVYLKKLLDIKVNMEFKDYDMYHLNEIKNGILKNEVNNRRWLNEILDELESKISIKTQRKRIA
jgi:hypothetical protein